MGALKYKVGDLIAAAKKGEIDVIAHGCNCQNTMRAGIAPMIAKAFPVSFLEDQKTTKGDINKLGTISGGECGNLMVFNLYSQYNFTGRREGKVDLDYWALFSALGEMSSILKSRCKDLGKQTDQFRIGLPKIGAGLAGGDWNIISKIIEDRLCDFHVTIYVLRNSGLSIVQ